MIVNHICEVQLVLAVVTRQEIKQRVELVQLLFCVILNWMVRIVSVNTGGGSVCQSKSIEISAFGNGINITGRSQIGYVRLNTHPCKQQKMQEWEKVLGKTVLVQSCSGR